MLGDNFWTNSLYRMRAQTVSGFSYGSFDLLASSCVQLLIEVAGHGVTGSQLLSG